MFTKYGYNTMGIVFIVVFILIVLSIYFDNNFVRIPLILFSAFLIIFTLNFFRDPDRTVPNKSNIVVSPADGRVLFVKDVIDDKFMNSKAKMVSIFMSPLNVHVNRIPITGKVEYVKYIQGEYLAAFEDKVFLIGDFSPASIKIFPKDESVKWTNPYKFTSAAEVRKYTEHLFNIASVK